MTFRSDLIVFVPALFLVIYCAYSISEDVKETMERLERRARLELRAKHRLRAKLGFTKINIDILESVFEEVGQKLTEVEAVGFVDRRGPRDSTPSGAYYFIAQYALAPIRVYESLEFRYIVGIFPSQKAIRRRPEMKSMKIVGAFFNGIFLLENERYGQ